MLHRYNLYPVTLIFPLMCSLVTNIFPTRVSMSEPGTPCSLKNPSAPRRKLNRFYSSLGKSSRRIDAASQKIINPTASLHHYGAHINAGYQSIYIALTPLQPPANVRRVVTCQLIQTFIY